MQLFSWFIQANNNKVKLEVELEVEVEVENNTLVTSNKKQNCNMWPIAVVRQPPLEKQK